MQRQVHGAIELARRVFSITLHLEERMKPATLSIAGHHEVHERVHAALSDVRINGHVEPRVEKRMRTEKRLVAGLQEMDERALFVRVALRLFPVILAIEQPNEV